MQGFYYEAKTSNPHENLAIEEYLLQYCEVLKGAICYLWQNDNTVVIGRNQNAYTECNLNYILENNIRIARRLTGGGAVFHDMGNLNYTMILPKRLYDIERSTNVILDALKSLGISADKNGRNDICIGERKISGNAYYSNAKVGMHHGTILYDLNYEKMEKALSVSKYKFAKHGITSVRSRVGDIKSLYADINIANLKKSIRESFCKEYGIEQLNNLNIAESAVAELQKKYFSNEWNVEKIKDYEIAVSQNFSWGTAKMSLCFSGEKMQRIEIATDALETDIFEKVRLEVNLELERTSGRIGNSFFKALAQKYEENKDIVYDIRDLFVKLEVEKDRADC